MQRDIYVYLVDKLCDGLSDGVSTRLRSAYAYAKEKHGDAKYKSSDVLYIVHPVRVAILVKNAYQHKKTAIGDEECDTLVAALLHDVVEDCAHNTRERVAMEDEIAEKFGERVARTVCEVTGDKDIPEWRRKKDLHDHVMGKCVAAQLVTFADRIDNCRDLQRVPDCTWTTAQIEGYFVWSHLICLQMCKISEFLHKQMWDVCKSEFIDQHSGCPIPCIPEHQLWHQVLYEYYLDCAKQENQEKEYREYLEKRHYARSLYEDINA